MHEVSRAFAAHVVLVSRGIRQGKEAPGSGGDGCEQRPEPALPWGWGWGLKAGLALGVDWGSGSCALVLAVGSGSGAGVPVPRRQRWGVEPLPARPAPARALRGAETAYKGLGVCLSGALHGGGSMGK